jgi:hypothetical protein
MLKSQCAQRSKHTFLYYLHYRLVKAASSGAEPQAAQRNLSVRSAASTLFLYYLHYRLVKAASSGAEPQAALRNLSVRSAASTLFLWDTTCSCKLSAVKNFSFSAFSQPLRDWQMASDLYFKAR